MTSPARRTTTVSPMRTPLRLTSSSLCNVAVLTITPPTCTGSRDANGVTRPVRPTLTKMLLSLVVASSGGYFHATAHRGDLLVEPSRPCNGSASTLTTTPSMSCSTSCRCSPQCATYRRTPSTESTTS